MTDSKEKFTPGPWISAIGNSSGREIIAPNSPKTRARVARLGGADRDGNAHLISAAPEMYEALKRVAEYDVFGELPDELMSFIESTLAKSRGEAL